MAKVKGAHHQGSYHVTAAKLRAAATADPSTRCWRCGKTLTQHKPHRNGKPATWTAGHVHPGEPDGMLLPEASTCNYRHGAQHGNARRNPRRTRSSRRW